MMQILKWNLHSNLSPKVFSIQKIYAQNVPYTEHIILGTWMGYLRFNKVFWRDTYWHLV